MFKSKLNRKLKNEITARLKNNYKLNKVILFGSYATGNANKNSDIDILVILDKPGITSSYIEKIKQRHEIAKLFYDIKTQTPMDILVYTNDEWTQLEHSDNPFVQEINTTGVQIA